MHNELQTREVETIPPCGLAQDVRQTTEQIRSTFCALIESVCGGAPRAQDVAEAFGIHRKLGWQVWNVAYTSAPLEAIRFVPSGRSLLTWEAAASRMGVPQELTRRLRETPDLYEALVARHAEDREMFEMLVESAGEHGDPEADLRWRRQAFLGNSYVWGVRAKTLLAAAFLHPAQRPGFFDMVRVQGLIGFVRTRPDVRWPFAQSIVETEDGVQRRPRREALTPTALSERTGVPLMEAFCSRPTAPVQRRLGESGMLEDELLPGPVGESGKCTVITGERMREVAPIYATAPGEHAMFGTGVRTPAEMLICDQFVHRDVFPGAERELWVLSELISPTTQDERDRLRVSERIQDLGRGLGRVRTAEVPRHGELLETVFQATGWNPDEFHAFRVRMRYPPIAAAVMMRHALPDAPPGLELH